MSRSMLPRFPRAGRTQRFARLALAGLTACGAVGCQITHPKPHRTAAVAQESPAPPTGTAEASQPTKPEFAQKVGSEQEFNVHMEMARVYESQGGSEAAVAEYQKAAEVCERKGSRQAGAKLGPAQHALVQRRMAGAFDRAGRFPQAEVHYQKALKLAPKDPKVWNDAGYSYYLQNRWADAERCLKTADSLGPNDPRVQTNLGLALAAQGKEDEALAALTRAGGPAVGHANLGYILAALGKTEKSRYHYEAALKLQPGLNAARLAVAQLDAPRPTPPATVVSSPNRDPRVKTASAETSIPMPVSRR